MRNGYGDGRQGTAARPASYGRAAGSGRERQRLPGPRDARVRAFFPRGGEDVRHGAAVEAVHPAKLYIPFYNCVAVRDALDFNGFPYEQYYLNDSLEPDVESLAQDEWILYVNYFGIASDEKKERMIEKYKNVIFDNTQAFYSPPVLDGNCMNVYSPRKFIGVADGGYLVWSGEGKVNEEALQMIFN